MAKSRKVSSARNGVKVQFTWRGESVKQKAQRAMARGTIALGEAISGFAKEYVDVITGDLRRSIHIAKADTLGQQRATQQAVTSNEGALLDVGSWLDYACVEETGRMHQYMHPAVEQARGYALTIMSNAFKSEGF
jgi:hypothetical protein